jgi:hypothetical protein
MYQIRRYRKAQSVIEYVVLFCVVLSALLLMSIYVKRAYSGRLKADADSISSQQYAPEHTTSVIVTTVTTNSESCTGTDCRGLEIPEGVTVTWSDTVTNLDHKERVDSFATE